MKQYYRVLKQGFKNSFSYLLAYRADMFMKMFVGVGWSLTYILIIELLFAHTPTFNGWTKTDILLLALSFSLGIELAQGAGRYIIELELNVRKGRFDTIVTKPIDSQFLSIFLRPDLSTYIYMVFHELPFVYLLWRYQADIQWEYLPLYIFLIINANILWLAMKTLLMTLNFWKQRLDNLVGLLYTITESGKYPVTIFPKSIQFLFYSFLPLALIGMVPAEALRGTVTWQAVAGSCGVTIAMVVFSRIVWKVAIRRYTSASS